MKFDLIINLNYVEISKKLNPNDLDQTTLIIMFYLKILLYKNFSSFFSEIYKKDTKLSI